ncbi:hypothetical protein CWO84_16490 [Methylomonas sp. Kb3]|nr:hypothetical protein CWO84_16490 [Methylomonas sp. Kb3]
MLIKPALFVAGMPFGLAQYLKSAKASDIKGWVNKQAIFAPKLRKERFFSVRLSGKPAGLEGLRKPLKAIGKSRRAISGDTTA